MCIYGFLLNTVMTQYTFQFLYFGSHHTAVEITFLLVLCPQTSMGTELHASVNLLKTFNVMFCNYDTSVWLIYVEMGAN
jgi:hypothetical protein